MATTTAPRTPAVAVARELRALGLEQGTGKDFRVTGHYAHGERDHTYVLLLSRRAHDGTTAHADLIEERTGAAGFPFRVSVRYFGTDRPTASVANGGARVRDTPPQPEAPAEAPAAPVVDHREQYRQERQAAALGWSTRHAQAVAWAAAGRLVRDAAGTVRLLNATGRPGRRVAAALLPPLERAGFLADVEDGPSPARIEPTPDGRRALLVWQLQQPAPVERPRKKEGLPLRPLLGGEEARRRAAALAADEERRRVEREAWYAAAELRWAAEAREDRLNDVWARVQGMRYRLGRKRPAGWVPSPQEVERYALDAQTVAELRAQAAPAVEEGPAAPPVRVSRVVVAAPRRSARPCLPARVRGGITAGGSPDTTRRNLTLQRHVATIGS
jgi:hypothetical protein